MGAPIPLLIEPTKGMAIMYAVLGANGRAGGEVARALIDRGETVRVVLRHREQGKIWAARGAEIAVASIEDADATAAALTGVSAAFLLNPPPVSGDPFARTADLGTALAAAAQRARLPRAIVLSSIGAQHAAGTGVIATLNRFEALLEGAAQATAFLRAGYFVETWSEVAATVVSDGLLPTFLDPDQPIPMVSTIDVGRTAADVLSETWTGKRVIELGGPEDWSARDVASAFARILGRPVATVPVPPEERAALLAAEGVPDEVAAALLGMYAGIAGGLFVRENRGEVRRGIVSLATAIERVLTKVEASGR